MTGEEAIKIIRKMLAYTDLSDRANLKADMVDACHLAIKALEQEPTTKNDLVYNLCDSCTIIGCIFQSGIVRTKCAFYMPPHVEYINRAELLKAMDTWDKFGNDPNEGLIPLRTPALQDRYVPYVKYDDMVNCVKGMSSVTPQEPRWIPVSERMPEPNRLVLCYITTGVTKTYFLAMRNEYYDDWEEGIGGSRLLGMDLGYKVLAWMPLPKPYSEVEE